MFNAFSKFLTSIRHGGVVVHYDHTFDISPGNIDLVKISLERALIYDSVAQVSAGSSATLGLHTASLSVKPHGQNKAA